METVHTPHEIEFGLPGGRCHIVSKGSTLYEKDLGDGFELCWCEPFVDPSVWLHSVGGHARLLNRQYAQWSVIKRNMSADHRALHDFEDSDYVTVLTFWRTD